jgi:lipopolysaccharide export system permease protein
MILHLYFARRFLVHFLAVLAVFFLIMLFLDLVEQLRRYADASLPALLTLSLLNIPRAIYEILPLIMILAAIALFIGLARSSELVVTRAAGRSALRALWAPLAVALLIGVVAVAVLNPIVAATSKEYESRGGALRGNPSILAVGSSGLWLRQGTIEGQSVIRAASANLDGTALRDVTVLTFGPLGGPMRRVNADTALLTDGAWEMTNAKVWTFDQPIPPEAGAASFARYLIASNLTRDEIRDSFGTPASIPIWELPAFIGRLQAAGFSAQRHQVWLQSEIAQPVFLMAMVMIGASFTIRHQRGRRTGLAVLSAVLLAFLIYFIRNFAQVLGENGQLPAALAAWAPPLAAIGIAFGVLLHNEDG